MIFKPWLVPAGAVVALLLSTGPAAAAGNAGDAKQCRTTAQGRTVCLQQRRLGVRPLASLLTNTVLPNQKVDLSAWVEYNPFDCSLVSSGAWQVTTPPTKGDVSFGIYSDVLSNGDCPGVIFPYALISYTWTSSDEAATQDSFAAQWVSPDYVEPDTFVENLATVKIDKVDFAAGTASLTIDGPPEATGTLTLEFSGATAGTATLTTTESYASGSATPTLLRPSIPVGVYDTLKVKWNASTPQVFGKLTPPRPWNVLGSVRYSQYNVPVESACTGGSVSVWVVDSLTACNFTQVNLNSNFASQVNVNGTGQSSAHGTLKAGAATSLRRSCRGHFPDGATLNTSYLQVSSVTGSCNTTLVADSSVATHPTQRLACGANLKLVRPDNSNRADRTRADTCPACNTGFGGGDGHIDSFTASQACTAHDVGDLGQFWTVQIR